MPSAVDSHALVVGMLLDAGITPFATAKVGRMTRSSRYQAISERGYLAGFKQPKRPWPERRVLLKASFVALGDLPPVIVPIRSGSPATVAEEAAQAAAKADAKAPAKK